MELNYRQIVFFVVGGLLALAPVFVASWFVQRQAYLTADEYLEEQSSLARQSAEMSFLDLRTELQTLASAAVTGCSRNHLDRMMMTTLTRPSVSVVAVLGPDRLAVCVAPDLPRDALQVFRDAEPIFEGDVALAQARVLNNRMTGIMLEYAVEENRTLALFVPRQMLAHFFDHVDDETGVVLTMGDTVIFARDPGTYDEETGANIDVTSLPLASGSMRVQVSIDRKLPMAAFEPFRQWAIVGAIIVGALILLLVMRIIHYTPARVNEIERAIEQDEFVPYYQPVIDVDSGKLAGCEMLVRWVKPDGTMVSPGAFINIAEQTGLAVPMTRKLMEAVVRDLREAYADKPGLKVAINLFNQHFTSLDIIEDVTEIFGPKSIAYGQVVLEITERAPLESMSMAKVIMRKLQGLGCRLALDDAGTGHGGLAYLQELGLDIVKVDKMFIDQLGKSRIGESITHTLTDLAKQLDMDVVAEGVERIEQVAHLRRYGIRQAQGYLFAPALPAKQYLELVEKLGVAEPRTSNNDVKKETSRKAATIRAATRSITEADADAA